MQQIVKDRGREDDIEFLRDLADQFNGTTICPLAIADAWPIESFTRKFRDQFDAYLARSEVKDEERDLVSLRPGGFM